MALPADYITGTITLTNGSVDFTGTDTGWLAADFREGDTIPYVAGGESFAPPIIATITSNTAGTLTTPWAGPTLTGVAYRMRYQWDSSRVSAQTRTMIEQLGNGNLQSISALTGPGVLVFDGPHSTVMRPETDFINGVAYDVQVDTLADRAAYDGQATGFSVLVSNVGDGRSAVYSKNSNTVGDWSDPAYVTGPVGPLPVLQVGDTTTLPPGSDATVNIVPVTGGYELDFGIPEGEGFNWAGVYNIANAYVQDDVVRHNNSSFIALQAVPAGTSPSSSIPPVDTAYWAVLAAKGQDGTGTGDVVGPAVAVADRIAAFDGTTGKLIKDAGVSVSSLAGFRNKIINGDFSIWQRATSQTVNGYGSADRWALSLGSGASCTLSRSTHITGQTVVPGNPLYYLSFARAAAGTSTSVVGEKIEGVSTLAGRQATLTFYARSVAATTLATQYTQNFGTGGSPSALVAGGIGTYSLTTAWQKFSVVFNLPSIAGKTLGSNGDDNLEITLRRPHDAANPTTTVEISRISLVEGDATTEYDPFAPRHVQQELALCQRYYAERTASPLITATSVGQYIVAQVFWPVVMRTAPSVTQVSGATANVSARTVDTITAAGARVVATATAASSAAYVETLKADAEVI